MAVSKEFARGYAVGKQRGYDEGLYEGLHGSAAELVMTKDLIYGYGVMAMELHDRGWPQDDIEDLIIKIQDRWLHLTDDRDPDDTETMAEMVFRITGIALEQAVQTIVEAGWEHD